MSNSVSKQKQEKKKHHYVWGHYLKSWSTDVKRKNVWRTTKTKKLEQHKVDEYSISGMLYEDYFYKISNLDEYHLQIINNFFSKTDPSPKQVILNFMKVNFLRQKVEDSVDLGQKKYKEYLVYKSNFIEDMHSSLEKTTIPILDALANEDLSILDDEKNMLNFMYYIANQNVRTKPFKENIITYCGQKNPKFAEKLEECWWLVSYFLGITLGYSLYISSKSDKHSLLINDTGESFLTSDSPVINVHPSISEDSVKLLEDHALDLYYPISPRIAYTIYNSDIFPNGKVSVTLDQVVELNTKMAKRSNLSIVGNNREIVEKYKKYVGSSMKVIKKAK